MHRIVVALSLVFCGACLSDTTLRDVSQITPQSRLAVQLTAAGSFALSADLGEGTDFVEGVIQTVRPDTLHLAVIRTGHPRRGFQAWSGELVHIPVSSTAAIAVRQLDRRRTALLSVGLMAATYFLIRASSLTVGGFEGSPDEETPPTPDLRQP